MYVFLLISYIFLLIFLLNKGKKDVTTWLIFRKRREHINSTEYGICQLIYMFEIKYFWSTFCMEKLLWIFRLPCLQSSSLTQENKEKKYCYYYSSIRNGYDHVCAKCSEFFKFLLKWKYSLKEEGLVHKLTTNLLTHRHFCSLYFVFTCPPRLWNLGMTVYPYQKYKATLDDRSLWIRFIIGI